MLLWDLAVGLVAVVNERIGGLRVIRVDAASPDLFNKSTQLILSLGLGFSLERLVELDSRIRRG